MFVVCRHTHPPPPVCHERGDTARLRVRCADFGPHSHNYCLATNLGSAPDGGASLLSSAATVQMVCVLFVVLCVSEQREVCSTFWKAATGESKREQLQ